MKRLCLALVGALSLSSASFGAEWLKSLGTVSGSYESMVRGHVSATPGAGHVIGNGNYLAATVKVGAIRTKYGTGSTRTNAVFGTEFFTFCITPFEELGRPNDTWMIDSPTLYNGTSSVSTDYDRIARLVSFGWNSLVETNAVYGAAFQLALWSIVQDATTSQLGQFYSNLLLSNSSVNTQYLAFLDIANGNSAFGTQAGKMMLYRPNPLGDSQILISKVMDGGGGSSPVPEPFTIGLGLAAAGAYVRRRVQQSRK